MSRITIDLSAIPTKITGVGRYAIEMVSTFGSVVECNGLDLVCLTRKGDVERIQRLLPGRELLGIVPNSRAARLLFEERGLGRMLGRSSIALHHSIHYTIPRGFKGKVVTTIHDSTFLEHPEWHERSKVVFFKRAMAHAAKEADALIFPSESTKAGFLRHFDPVGYTEVIPHGVNVERFGLEQSDAESLERLGIKQPFLLFCGTLEPRKNLPRVIEAFAGLNAEDLVLVVAGLKGWGASAFTDPTTQNLLRDRRVIVVGYVSDLELGALYRQCIASLYPSLEEGFGLPALEAVSQGTLLITSAGSAMIEVIGDGALTVDPLSVSCIREAIEVAVVGGAAVDAIRRRGIEMAKGFSWKSVAEKHCNLYRRILGA